MSVQVLLKSLIFLLLSGHPNFLASKDSLLCDSISVSYVFSFSFLVQVEEVEGVSYHTTFDAMVERRVSGKRGCMIYFDEPDVKLFIQHDIETQDLETH